MTKILVIDDDDSFRTTTAKLLRRKEFQVVEAINGEHGLAEAFHSPPDLVLSDVGMLGLNGFDVVRELRTHGRTATIPVILMTGAPEEYQMRSGMELGADDFLSKPFDPPTLYAAVQMRLDRSRQIQKQALEREALMLEVLSATLDIVAIANASDGYLMFLNPAGRRMLGISASEDISALHLNDFLESSRANWILGNARLTGKGRAIWRGECNLSARNGATIPVSQQVLPHFSSSGKITHLSIVAHDLTERIQSEQALRESESRYRELVHCQGEGLIFADATQRFIFVNPAAAEIFGLPSEQIIGCKLENFLDDAGRSTVQQQVELRKTGVRTSYELELIVGQKRKWVLITGTPHLDANGRFLGSYAVFRDISEAKATEATLRQKTAMLEALINSSLDGILVLNSEHEKLIQNPQFARLLNIPQAIAENSDDRVQLQFVTDTAKNPKQFLDRVRHLNAHPAETGRDEIEIQNGRIFDRYSAPVIGKDRKYYGRIWMFRDITERKQAEERLRLQTSALEAADNGILISDCAGRILWVNTAFSKLTGYASTEVLGKTPAILKSGSHPAEFYRHLWNSIKAGNVWHGEIVNRRKDGSRYCEEMIITPVRDPHGVVRNFIAIKQDITKRKQGENRLRQSVESFRTLADNVPDAIARLDRQNRFVYVNRVMLATLGLSPNEILGKTNAELNLTASPAWHDAIAQVFKTGEIKAFEFQIETAQGTQFMETRLVPEQSSADVVQTVLAVTRNVTEQKLAHKQQQMLDVQLRQSQKLEAIGQLAAGIAHEINTPTQYVGDNTRFLQESFEHLRGVLRSHGELLAATRQNAVTPDLVQRAGEILAASDLDYLNEQIPAAIEESLEGIQRVSKIVRAMKEFSHPGGREKTTADLNKAIESTVTVARNEWKYVAEMSLDLEPTLPAVPCFVGEFNQVILNLVINAAHAIAEVVKQKPGTKGRITIRTRRQQNQVEVRVSDTGTGIAPEHRTHIFEPFFTTKDVGRGTGQGLAMVYGSIVQKHGGSVKFETECGQGTTFVIHLPFLPANLTEPQGDTSFHVTPP